MFGIPFRLDLPGPAADFYSVAAVLFAELFVRPSIYRKDSLQLGAFCAASRRKALLIIWKNTTRFSELSID
jgi:hypothetical protein